MKSYGPIDTLYKDCTVPKPNPGSADGASFGDAMAGPSKADGIMEEVQFSSVGPKIGAKQPGPKIPGGGSS